MASRLLNRLKRSLFKDGQGSGPKQEAACGQEGESFKEDSWEAELDEEEEEQLTDRLGGTLCFDAGGGEGVEGEEPDSDSDFLGESMEEGLSSTDTSPVGVSPVPPPPAFLLTRQLQESWGTLRGLGGGSPASSGRQPTDDLLFEVTDACVVLEASSKYVLYTIHVGQSADSDQTPAVITRRYSDFQRLHAALRRNHGHQMERVCFPRKKMRRNYTAETIAKRSRAFEQYLSHLCSLSGPRGAPCVRHFFYLTDLQAGQLLIRVGRFHEALAPLLNAKRLQQKLGWATYYDSQAPPPASSHWFFTLVGLSSCFQEVDQLEEARDHCDGALRVLSPEVDDGAPPLRYKPRPQTEERPESPQHVGGPHPLLLPLLRVVVRLSWQTGKDKRQWEELLQKLEEQRAGLLDNQPTIKEFLVKHNLEASEGEG
ncbi:LOW QUALITY PROTEIN: sorting nexin-21 [Spinachia spinachia]